MSDSKDSAADLALADSNLGRALVLLHRAAVRLDDPTRYGEVQAALRQAAGFVEAARLAHEGATLPGATWMPGDPNGVDAITSAVIAAAVSVCLDQPFRLVAVRSVTAPIVPHLNIWSVEGRTRLFLSHRVRL